MKVRKKPVVVNAVQWLVDNEAEMMNFMGAVLTSKEEGNSSLFIPTLEGVMEAKPGDWIIEGINGEFYPCKPDIFDKTYEILT